VPFVRANGLFLHYEDESFVPPWREPAVALLHHGALRTSGMWYGWLPELARGLRVIRPDARGHGRSQAPPPDYRWRISDLVEDVRALLDALDLRRVHYVGESLGGVIGILLATAYPERVQSLTLCAAPTRIREGAARLRALDYPDWASAIAALGVRGWYLAYRERTGDLHPEDPGRDEWFAAEAGRSPAHVITGLTGMVAVFDVSDRLGQIRAPTLVLSPARSPLSASPEQQRALAAAIPGARLAVIDGPGHHIYLDRAAECAAATAEFIGSLAG
jgi:pimeloyl-ACP methyl ester carboxylesterase